MFCLSVVADYNEDGYPERLDSSWINSVVSSGTLRDEDLLESFSEVLDLIPETQRIARKCRAGVRLTRMLERTPISAKDPQYWNLKTLVSEFLNWEVFEAMQDIAPDNCYFGASEGDGSLFGFWSEEEDSF